MRLLFFTNVFPNPLQPTKGVFNLELVRALSEDNEVSVICPVAWTDECAAIRRGKRLRLERSRVADGIPVCHPRFYFPPKVLREYYGQFMWHSVKREVFRELDRLKPDAVLSYWAHPDGEVAVRAAHQVGIPSIVMVGGSDVLLLTANPRRQRRILRVLHQADAVVAVSRHLSQRLVDSGVRSERIHVVPRGVDTSVFHPGDRNSARRRLAIHSEVPLLLWVGRMVPVKGLDVLLRTCGHLSRQGIEFELFLVGDGPLRGAIEQQARAHGISDRVHFPGVVNHDDLPDWYRAADLTVLPSRSEGVPNVLRESLACGTPFVASNVGGICELAPASVCLVPPDDCVALANAIMNALSRPSTVGPRSQNAAGWRESAEAVLQVLRTTGVRSSQSPPTSRGEHLGKSFEAVLR